MDPLTDAQVENWRKAMAMQYGEAWLTMPREHIEKMRQAIQRAFDVEHAQPPAEPEDHTDD